MTFVAGHPLAPRLAMRTHDKHVSVDVLTATDKCPIWNMRSLKRKRKRKRTHPCRVLQRNAAQQVQCVAMV